MINYHTFLQVISIAQNLVFSQKCSKTDNWIMASFREAAQINWPIASWWSIVTNYTLVMHLSLRPWQYLDCCMQNIKYALIEKIRDLQLYRQVNPIKIEKFKCLWKLHFNQSICFFSITLPPFLFLLLYCLRKMFLSQLML